MVLNRSFCLNKPCLADWRRQKRVKVVLKSFFFSVWVQTYICVANEYLFETRVPNSTLYLSLCDNHVEPNTLHLFPCLLFTMETTPGFFYMFGKTLEEQNLVYCVGKIQLLVLVMRCRLKPEPVHWYNWYNCTKKIYLPKPANILPRLIASQSFLEYKRGLVSIVSRVSSLTCQSLPPGVGKWSERGQIRLI